MKIRHERDEKALRLWYKESRKRKEAMPVFEYITVSLFVLLFGAIALTPKRLPQEEALYEQLCSSKASAPGAADHVPDESGCCEFCTL